MKKRDFLLIGSILAIALSMILGYQVFIKKPGAQIQIIVDGVLTQTLELNQDADFIIEGDNNKKNHLLISDGYAKMVDATCPDKLCIHQKKIHYNGETIVCLPNKVVVKVISYEQPSLDAVAN